jgi:hypothetical protein
MPCLYRRSPRQNSEPGGYPHLLTSTGSRALSCSSCSSCSFRFSLHQCTDFVIISMMLQLGFANNILINVYVHTTSSLSHNYYIEPSHFSHFHHDYLSRDQDLRKPPVAFPRLSLTLCISRRYLDPPLTQHGLSCFSIANLRVSCHYRSLDVESLDHSPVQESRWHQVPNVSVFHIKLGNEIKP